MISAPASIAARATAALLVSIEIGIVDLRRELLDDRQHAAQFFVGVDRLGVRPRAFAADVEQVGPVGDQLQRMGDRGIASRNCPPSEKLSGVTLTMPITSGRRGNSSVRVRSCH